MKTAPYYSLPLQNALDLAAKFPALRLAAYRTAQTVLLGQHGRRAKGQGEEFWQFRKLAAGEALTRVDWRQSARSQHLYIRETERLSMQTICLWVDFSPSMAWSSRQDIPTKLEYALVQVLALSYCILDSQERLAFINPYTQEKVYFNSPLHFPRLCDYLYHLVTLLQTSTFPPPLPNLPSLPAHSHMIIWSDGFFSPQHLSPLLKTLATGSTQKFFLHINDPEEKNFSFEGRILFEGTEQEETILLANARSAQKSYQLTVTSHNSQLATICKTCSTHYLPFLTTQKSLYPLQRIYTLFGNSLKRGI